MYLNGMGLRGIERVTDIHHTTVMHWVREAGMKIPDAPEADELPEITDMDEQHTNVCNKANKIWKWMRRQSLVRGNCSLGDRRPQCRYVQTTMVHRQMLAELLVRHRWVCGLSRIYLAVIPHRQ